MVKQITIISGKGGSGKTTLTAAFTALAKNLVIVDADVDAADMHLLLHPQIRSSENFHGLNVAQKNDDICTDCGLCYDNCRYSSFDSDNTLHLEKCEGCAVCELVCPVGAIKMVQRVAGESYVSDTRFGKMVHAKMHPGEEATGKLVALVREKARKIAEKEENDLIIIDGPPGTGCTVIASITGVDLVLIVIEPTLSGIHDAKRMIEVARHFQVPTVACINKYDINEENTADIIEFCKAEGIGVIGKLAYDETATRAMMDEKTVVEFSVGQLAADIKDIWKKLEKELVIS